STRPPTYVKLDAGFQHPKGAAMPTIRAPNPVPPAETTKPTPNVTESAPKFPSSSKHPVTITCLASRSQTAWIVTGALAEALQAPVYTDMMLGAAFPTDDRLHAAPPATFLTLDAAKLLRDADVVLALDWVDLAGVLKQVWGAEPVGAKVIQVSPDAHLHRGW